MSANMRKLLGSASHSEVREVPYKARREVNWDRIQVIRKTWVFFCFVFCLITNVGQYDTALRLRGQIMRLRHDSIPYSLN